MVLVRSLELIGFKFFFLKKKKVREREDRSLGVKRMDEGGGGGLGFRREKSVVVVHSCVCKYEE